MTKKHPIKVSLKEPLVTQEIIDYLDVVFPDSIRAVEMTSLERAQGRRDVITKLQSLFDTQNQG